MTQQNEEFDFNAEIAPVGETKASRFTRVMNHRLGVAAERLRMMGQMFEGANANNYDFSAEQIDKLETLLAAEIAKVIDPARRALAKRNGRVAGDNLPQL